MLYEWTKALHIISVIVWMAGLLCLPRLFAHHAEAVAGSDAATAFQAIERRLHKRIMMPAMIGTWVFGLFLAYDGGWFAFGWLHAKLLLVFVLSGFDGFLAAEGRRLAADRATRSPGFYRMIGLVPVCIMIAAVLLVVLKPF